MDLFSGMEREMRPLPVIPEIAKRLSGIQSAAGAACADLAVRRGDGLMSVAMVHQAKGEAPLRP